MPSTDNLDAATDAELNMISAVEVRGWTLIENETDRYYRKGRGKRYKVSMDLWQPTADHNDMASVRTDIRRQGLEAEYASNLYDLIAESIPETKDDAKNDDLVLWAIDDAPLRDKVKAAIRAVRGAKT